MGLGGRRKFAGAPDERWAGVGEKPHDSQGNASNGAPRFAHRRLRRKDHRRGVFQSLGRTIGKSFGCPRFSVQALVRAGVFLAEAHYTDIGIPKIVEDALPDFAVTGRSGEYLVSATVAYA